MLATARGGASPVGSGGGSGGSGGEQQVWYGIYGQIEVIFCTIMGIKSLGVLRRRPRGQSSVYDREMREMR